MDEKKLKENRFYLSRRLIGWGFFGFGYAQNLAIDHPLYLESGLSYILITLLLHLIYGWVLGYLSSRWLVKSYKKGI